MPIASGSTTSFNQDADIYNGSFLYFGRNSENVHNFVGIYKHDYSLSNDGIIAKQILLEDKILSTGVYNIYGPQFGDPIDLELNRTRPNISATRIENKKFIVSYCNDSDFDEESSAKRVKSFCLQLYDDLSPNVISDADGTEYIHNEMIAGYSKHDSCAIDDNNAVLFCVSLGSGVDNIENIPTFNAYKMYKTGIRDVSSDGRIIMASGVGFTPPSWELTERQLSCCKISSGLFFASIFNNEKRVYTFLIENNGSDFNILASGETGAFGNPLTNISLQIEKYKENYAVQCHSVYNEESSLWFSKIQLIENNSGLIQQRGYENIHDAYECSIKMSESGNGIVLYNVPADVNVYSREIIIDDSNTLTLGSPKRTFYRNHRINVGEIAITDENKFVCPYGYYTATVQLLELTIENSGGIPIYTWGSVPQSSNFNNFSYGISSSGERRGGTNFSKAITSCQLNPIYGGQYHDGGELRDKIYGKAYVGEDDLYYIEFFADSGRLYPTLRYSSENSSETNIEVIGSGYGVGLSGVLSYDFGA